MKNFKAVASNPTNNNNKYEMFVGRWQPLHDGHKWLFNQPLSEGKNVLICIRDVQIDEKNPYKSEDIKTNIETYYKDLIELGKVKVIIIPDIASISYGRGVGYDVIEYVPPKEIEVISATKIREELKLKGLL